MLKKWKYFNFFYYFIFSPFLIEVMCFYCFSFCFFNSRLTHGLFALYLNPSKTISMLLADEPKSSGDQLFFWFLLVIP